MGSICSKLSGYAKVQHIKARKKTTHSFDLNVFLIKYTASFTPHNYENYLNKNNWMLINFPIDRPSKLPLLYLELNFAFCHSNRYPFKKIRQFFINKSSMVFQPGVTSCRGSQTYATCKVLEIRVEGSRCQPISCFSDEDRSFGVARQTTFFPNIS